MEMKGRQQLYKVIKYHSDPFLFQQYFRVPMEKGKKMEM